MDLLWLKGGDETVIGTVETTAPLFPGQVSVLDFPVAVSSGATKDDEFSATIDPAKNTNFKECRDDNNDGVFHAFLDPVISTLFAVDHSESSILPVR